MTGRTAWSRMVIRVLLACMGSLLLFISSALNTKSFGGDEQMIPPYPASTQAKIHLFSTLTPETTPDSVRAFLPVVFSDYTVLTPQPPHSTSTQTVQPTVSPNASITPTPTANPTQTVLEQYLLPGDILTRDSASLPLAAHDALYTGNGQIIDSLPDGGVQQRSLAGFIADAEAYLVAHRLVDRDQAVVIGVLNYAVQQIGTPYDYAYFGGKDTEDKMYCSELLWRAYLSQDIDLDANGGAWVWPWEILWSESLKQVDFPSHLID